MLQDFFSVVSQDVYLFLAYRTEFPDMCCEVADHLPTLSGTLFKKIVLGNMFPQLPAEIIV